MDVIWIWTTNNAHSDSQLPKLGKYLVWDSISSVKEKQIISYLTLGLSICFSIRLSQSTISKCF